MYVYLFCNSRYVRYTKQVHVSKIFYSVNYRIVNR